MVTLDNIVGSNLEEIYLLKYVASKDHYWVDSIVMKFDNGYFIINVNADTDEVQTNIQDSYQIDTSQDNVIVISNCVDNQLLTLIGNKLTWVWTMTNNQGYSDGIQFQFNSKTNSIVQFIAIASGLQINMLNRTETPSL
jgi:hypothetical protein